MATFPDEFSPGAYGNKDPEHDHNNTQGRNRHREPILKLRQTLALQTLPIMDTFQFLHSTTIYLFPISQILMLCVSDTYVNSDDIFLQELAPSCPGSTYLQSAFFNKWRHNVPFPTLLLSTQYSPYINVTVHDAFLKSVFFMYFGNLCLVLGLFLLFMCICLLG